MFTLLSGFYDHLFSKKSYIVVILGLDNAGKTTFFEHARNKLMYRSRQLKRIFATVGVNIGLINVDNVTLNFWDLGGQRDLRRLWAKYFKEPHAVVWVVDSSDKARLGESCEAFKAVLGDEQLEGLPLLFVLNKRDLPSSMETSEILEAFGLMSNCGDHNDGVVLGKRPFMKVSVSALKGENLEKCIQWLGAQVSNGSKQPLQI